MHKTKAFPAGSRPKPSPSSSSTPSMVAPLRPRITRKSRPPSAATQRRLAVRRQKRLEDIGKRLGTPYPKDDKEPITYNPKQTRARTKLIRSTFRRTNDSFIDYLSTVYKSEKEVQWLPKNVPREQQYAVLPLGDDLSDYSYRSPSPSASSEAGSLSSLDPASDTDIYGLQVRTPPPTACLNSPRPSRTSRSSNTPPVSTKSQ